MPNLIDGIPVTSNRLKWDKEHNADSLVHYTECTAKCAKSQEHGPESFPYYGGTWEVQTQHTDTDNGPICSHCGAPSRVDLEYNEDSNDYKWPPYKPTARDGRIRAALLQIARGSAVPYYAKHLARQEGVGFDMPQDCRDAIARAELIADGKEEPTPVIFRRWPKKEGGGLIALFPSLAGDMNPSTCLSYETIGQHGAACTRLVYSTKPADYESADVAKLMAELNRAGYYLKPVKRITQKHDKARISAIS